MRCDGERLLWARPALRSDLGRARNLVQSTGQSTYIQRTYTHCASPNIAYMSSIPLHTTHTHSTSLHTTYTVFISQPF